MESTGGRIFPLGWSAALHPASVGQVFWKGYIRFFPQCTLTSSPPPLTARYNIYVRANKAIYLSPPPPPPFCLGFDLASSLFKVLRLSLSTLPVLAGAFPCRSRVGRASPGVGRDGQGQQTLAKGSVPPTAAAQVCNIRVTYRSSSAKALPVPAPTHIPKNPDISQDPPFSFCH